MVKTKRSQYKFITNIVDGKVFVDARTVIEILKSVISKFNLPGEDIESVNDFEVFVNEKEKEKELEKRWKIKQELKKLTKQQ